MNILDELIDLIKDYIDTHEGREPNTVKCTKVKLYDFLKLNFCNIGGDHCNHFLKEGTSYCTSFVKAKFGLNLIVVPQAEISSSTSEMEVTIE